MATQANTEKLLQAKAIADLMANCKPEHLLDDTLANAGAALVAILDEIEARA